MALLNFDLSGISVSIATHSPQLLELYADYFRYYSPAVFAYSKNPLIRIELKLQTTLPDGIIDQDAKLISQAGIVEFWRTSEQSRERFYLKTNVSIFRLTPETGRVVGIISVAALNSPNLLVNTYTFAALQFMLCRFQRYHLHTAAVVSPDKKLHLICGGQRAGKTTLTTALGVAGWQPISDDGVLLQEREPGKPCLQAFKRDFHLTSELLQQWPELRHVISRHDYQDRSCLNGLELFAAGTLADNFFTQVNCIIFPTITDEPESRLETLSASAALPLLIEQSMYFPLWPEHTKLQIKLLSELVKDASCFRLLAGRDIWENPHCAAVLLENLPA